MRFDINQANLACIPQMRELVLPEVKNGVILERSEDEIAANIRSYAIVREISDLKSNNKESCIKNTDSSPIIAFCALHIHSSTLGEIRSLIVAPNYRRHGIASALIKYCINEGKILGLEKILTLTYTPTVFIKAGFKQIAKELIPNQKIWTDCIKCKHFPICDEIALIKAI